MGKYLILAVILNFFVNLMLIMAAGRLSDLQCPLHRAVMGGLTGAVYMAACGIPRLWFLESRLWYGVSLLTVSLAAFGVERSTVLRGGIYCLLRLVLDGLTDGTDSFFDLIWAGCLSLVCLYGFRGGAWHRYVPVALRYGQKEVDLTALRDTGNTLRDPVTGRPVLVVGSDVAGALTGLTPQQLACPVETMGAFPGLRLIPYKTVESSGKFLLALQIKNARIGSRHTDTLVAFAPQKLDGNGIYQALIGGAV